MLRDYKLEFTNYSVHIISLAEDDFFILANSADPDEMLHFVASYL